jgi:hypothetical protein
MGHGPKLVTALLVRNEADKYLERVLTRCLQFSDQVLVLDDGSTDGSERLAWRLGCEVRQRTGQAMWGAEAPARAELWDWGAREAADDWLLIADADMLLHGDPRPLLQTQVHNAWAFVLYDLWNDERYYRCDGFWQGHRFPRPWLFRPKHLGFDVPKWPDRGLHTGHCPANAELKSGIANDLAWLHLAYLSYPNRLRKRDSYLAKAHLLTPFEQAHAASVGD